MSKDDDNEIVITDSLKKSLEINNRIAKSVEPILQTQEQIRAITQPMRELSDITKGLSGLNLQGSAFNAIKGAYTALDCIKDTPPNLGISSIIAKPISSIANFGISQFHFDTSAFKIANTMSSVLSNSLTTSIQGVLNNYSTALSAVIKSPFIDWIHTIDFTPLTRIWESWDFDLSISTRFDELNEIYLQAMYDAKWFPYAGWIADTELFAEVNDILFTSRPKANGEMSKRCEKRIDKAILSYYTTSEIKKIKKQWNNSDLEPHVKKALGQSIEAYLRKEYALVIPFLATMWEGLIYVKANNVTLDERHRQKMELTKQELSELTEDNEFNEIFSDYFNNYIVSQCNGVVDVVDGVPNRHGASHSWYVKYPNQKAALNAILLTDFIINLKPKRKTEEQENG